MKAFSFFSIVVMIFVIMIQFMPSKVYAKSLILVDCNYNENGLKRDGSLQPIVPNGTEYECGFPDMIAQIQKLINFAFLLALPIFTLAVTWAGIQILLAQGNSGALSKAKALFQKVIIGFLIVLVAWIFVFNITSYLLCPRYYTPFLGGNVPTGSDVAACKP